MIRVGIFWLVLSSLLYAKEFDADSVGNKIINGKKYILYEVEQGETLTRIAKKYGITVQQLRVINKLGNDNLTPGQIIKIPPTEPLENTNTSNTEPKTQSVLIKKPRYYTCVKGDNLYLVTKKNKILLRDLLDINELNSPVLSEGQVIIIGYDEERVTVPVEPEVAANPTTKPSQKSNPETPRERARKDSLAMFPNPQEKIMDAPEGRLPDMPAYATVKEKIDAKKKAYFEVSEAGKMQLIENQGKDAFRLVIYHPTLPVGTVVEILSNTTNRTVSAEVIGKYEYNPDTNYIISGTDRVFRYLGAAKLEPMEITVRYRL
ncbi:MAG: LysM peptidoglycan-binding domain-containing protein [Bacteroidia bacterium]|nr:LysM peptidoglycan-binding domain-containing protein [Bacteroidia bacterium]